MRDADLLEKQLDQLVVQAARALGWTRPMHIYDSRRSEPGWPDRAFVRDRLVLVELKTETGRVSSAQADWLTRLHHAHVEVYVVRPRHLQAITTVLAARGPTTTWTAAQHHARAELLDELNRHLTTPITPELKETPA